MIGLVISDTQSTFILEKQILDGILIANEIVDEVKHKGKKKEVFMFKVDI